MAVDLFNLCYLFLLHILLFLQPLQKLLLFLSLNLKVISLSSQLFEFILQSLSVVFGSGLFTFGLIKLSFDHFKFIFLVLFAFLLLLDLDLLQFLLPAQHLKLFLQVLFMLFNGVDFASDLVQLSFVGIETDLQNFLLLLQLLIGNGVLMNRCDLPLSYRIILLHQHMQLFHLRLQPLYLLLRQLLMLPR